MKINRNNYESFFLDFAEGRLNGVQQAELEIFLRENPDLKKELEEFEFFSFAENSEMKFENKSALKKNFISVRYINENNYENFLIGEIENDLNEVEKENLKKFVSENPFVEKEQKLFGKTILIPDEKIIFENKSSLKKTVVIHLNWQTVATAVAIAASILLLLYFNFKSTKNEIVRTNENKKEESTKSEIVRTNENKKENIVENTSGFIDEKFEIKNESAENSKEQIAEIFPDEKKKIEKEISNENFVKNDSEKVSENEALVSEPANNQTTNHSNIQNNDSFTFKEFLAFAFKKNVLKENVEKKKKEAKITPVDLASAAVKGISKIFGSKIKMNKEYAHGELASVSISSPNFEISRTVHGK